MAPGEKHLDLQKRAFAWLRSRVTGSGFRGAYEVWLAELYVADAVALGNFQDRYNRGYWNNHHKGPRFNHGHHERHYESVCVFEAKATRADFLSTFGKVWGNHENRFQPIGTHHWVVLAKDIAKPEEIKRLSFWGALVESGNGLREVRPPYWCNIQRQRVFEIAHALLWKRGYLMTQEDK